MFAMLSKLTLFISLLATTTVAYPVDRNTTDPFADLIQPYTPSGGNGTDNTTVPYYHPSLISTTNPYFLHSTKNILNWTYSITVWQSFLLRNLRHKGLRLPTEILFTKWPFRKLAMLS